MDNQNIIKNKFNIVLLLSICYVVAIILLPNVIPPSLGIDWRLTYRPAIRALIAGNNPYDLSISPEAPYFSAPWGLLPLIPLALLPVQSGVVAGMLIGLIAFAYSAYRLNAKPIAYAAFLLSPPVIHSIINTNFEWLIILGFVFPPSIGLFFVLVKPQTGIAVAVFWFFISWRKGRWLEIIRVFAPVTIAYIISFLLYGLWPLRWLYASNYATSFNSSFWPTSIPIGILLLFISIYKSDMRYAMSASPFLSPYVIFHTYSSVMSALLKKPVLLVAIVVFLWIWVIIRLIT